MHPGRIVDARLEAHYRLCNRICASASKSFHLASGLLPLSKRQAIRAMYAFCRTVDDIVDTPSNTAHGVRLDYWRSVSLGLIEPGQDPLAAAWVDALHRFNIPRRYAVQLIDGVAQDLVGRQYQTFDELTSYCYSVASTVGLMSMHVIGFKNEEALPYAIKLGVALQLTNILRDVGEDYRNGRLYLPIQELRGAGLHERDIAAGQVTPRWAEFIRFQIDRTRGLYAQARPGIRLLKTDGQLAIAAAAGLYEGILQAIEKNSYDVFTKRASLGGWEKMRRIPGIGLGLLLNA
jgi:phytoene synthase